MEGIALFQAVKKPLAPIGFARSLDALTTRAKWVFSSARGSMGKLASNLQSKSAGPLINFLAFIHSIGVGLISKRNSTGSSIGCVPPQLMIELFFPCWSVPVLISFALSVAYVDSLEVANRRRRCHTRIVCY